MPEDFDALEILRETGALQKGHFQLSSGRHSDTYIQCSMLLKEPGLAMAAGRAIAGRVLDLPRQAPGNGQIPLFPEAVGRPVDVVLAPALGAVVIGFTTAAALGVESIFAERVDGDMSLRRGFEIESGARVLLVEDVITTGGSILELADLVDKMGARVVALACIVQRGDFDHGGRPVVSLARVKADSYAPDECPLCERGAKVHSPGSRRNGND